MSTLKSRTAGAQTLLSAALSLTFMAGLATDPALANAHKKNPEVATVPSAGVEANSGADRAETKAQKREAKRRAEQQRTINDFNSEDSGIYLNAD